MGGRTPLARDYRLTVVDRIRVDRIGDNVRATRRTGRKTTLYLSGELMNRMNCGLLAEECRDASEALALIPCPDLWGSSPLTAFRVGGRSERLRAGKTSSGLE